MNAILEMTQVDDKNIIFYEPKNNMLVDGCYTKIMYSELFYTMDGLSIHFPVVQHFIHKNIMSYPMISNNITFIQFVKSLESVLLNLYSKEFDIHKKKNDSLYSQMVTGKVKIHKEIHSSPHTNTNINLPRNNSLHTENLNMEIEPQMTPSLIKRIPTASSISSMPSVPSMSSISSMTSMHSMNSLSSMSSHFSLPLQQPPNLIYPPPPGFGGKHSYPSSQLPTHSRGVDPTFYWYKSQIVLKIYGVWENNSQIGLTYRFVELFDAV